MDYKSMMADKETIDAITNNVAISYSDGIELPLIEKYNNFYFNVEKFIKYIDWEEHNIIIFSVKKNKNIWMELKYSS